MGILTPDSRRQLLAILDSMSVLDNPQARSGALLQDLPPALCNGIEHDGAKAVDLANIVQACDAWGADAVRTLMGNARDLVQGSDTATQIQQLLAALPTAPPAAPPDRPAAPPARVPPVSPGAPQLPDLAYRLPWSQGRPQLYLIAFVTTAIIALGVNGFTGIVFRQDPAAWVYTCYQPGLVDWVQGTAIVLAAALGVAWLLRCLRLAWLAALFLGITGGQTVFVLLMFALQPADTSIGFWLMLLSAGLNGVGCLVGMFVLEERQMAPNPGGGSPGP